MLQFARLLFKHPQIVTSGAQKKNSKFNREILRGKYKIFSRTSMLEYVRLLCKHPQFVYIINHRNHDTRANTKAKRRVQNLHRKGNSVKIFYFKALKFVRLLCKIPHKDYKFLKIVNPRPIMGPQEGFKFHHKNI